MFCWLHWQWCFQLHIYLSFVIVFLHFAVANLKNVIYDAMLRQGGAMNQTEYILSRNTPCNNVGSM
jgi:hypothetical protein